MQVARPILALLALFFANTAFAQEDAFTIRGVPIDATAQTAAAAREPAIANGAPRALRRLMERLTLPEDHERLPYVSSSQATSLAVGFRVENELRGANRYRGDLTVSFDPEGVRNLLRRAGVPFVETAAPPTLVVPVYVVDGQPTLWTANPWAEGWDESRYIGGFAPVVLPSGFGTGVSLISPQAVADGDLDTLALLADRYGLDRLLLAIARVQGEELVVDLTMVRTAEERDYNASPFGVEPDFGQTDRFGSPGGLRGDAPGAGDGFGGGPGPQAGGLGGEPYGDDDAFGAPGPRGLQPIAEALGQIRVRADESNTPFQLAADRAHELLIDDWKQLTVIRSRERTEVQLTVLYDSIDEWHTLRAALSNSPFVTDARLDALSRDGALMTIVYRGIREQLVSDLLRRGVQLSDDFRLGEVAYASDRLAPRGRFGDSFNDPNTPPADAPGSGAL